MNSVQKNLNTSGFIIDNKIIYLVNEQVLININPKERQNIKIRSTMANLLKYILENINNEMITDEELMENVWENNNLRASNARVWQVMRELKNRLREAGLDEELVYRVGRKGYLKRGLDIEYLYSKKVNGF